MHTLQPTLAGETRPASSLSEMDYNDPLFWLISEAIQQLGMGADPKALAERIRHLQVGLPAEDEFSVLLTWLGRCHLVHKLDRLRLAGRPPEATGIE